MVEVAGVRVLGGAVEGQDYARGWGIVGFRPEGPGRYPPSAQLPSVPKVFAAVSSPNQEMDRTKQPKAAISTASHQREGTD